MTTWVVVPCLDEGRDQLDDRFPNRAKLEEGSIGDRAHQLEVSSHNPDDESGVRSEHNDGDGIHEVRARDFDKNLNDDKGVVMEDVVQLWVKLARQGTLWWVRYIIFNGRIWHKRDGYVTRRYTGSNKHTGHAHVNSNFTAEADSVTGTNWQLAGLTKDSVPPTPSKPPTLDVDGQLGPKTIKRWQQVMHTPIDGRISTPVSDLVKAVQKRLKGTVNHNLAIDGRLGQHTIAAMQKYLKTPVDGHISSPKSQVVMALQRRLNTGQF